MQAVRIGRNTINLHNLLFMRIVKTTGANSEGKVADVFLLKILFTGTPTLELQFDTLEACKDARDFVETALGGVKVMPDYDDEE